MVASLFVNGIAYHGSVPIDRTVFAGEVFVLGVDMIGVGLFLISAQFSAQVFAVHPYEELIGAWGVVFHSVIQIVVNDAGACSERYLAIEVREEVESVVMMVLDDGEV